ncbi:MAG: hypothetical protein ACLSV2_07770 [Clostridium sp.]
MENKKETLGAGIITFSVISLISAIVFGAMFIGLVALGGKEVERELFSVQVIVQIVLFILSIVGIILILRRRKFGAYLYFASWILSTVYSVVSEGFILSNGFEVLIMLTYGYFIYKKRHLFK